MIRLVLFDIDGTLIHTGGAGIKAFARVLATQFGIEDGLGEVKFAGRTDTGLVREIFQRHRIPVTRENLMRFFDAYVHLLDHILAHSRCAECPGIREWLCDARQLPEPPLRGLLTGNIQLGAEIKLRHFRLWEEFETGAFADEHEDRDHIAHAAQQRGSRVTGRPLRGEEILVIGDTPLDIRCGRAIGAKVLAVATGGATYEELQRHNPDWLARDLTQVSPGEVCDRA